MDAKQLCSWVKDLPQVNHVPRSSLIAMLRQASYLATNLQAENAKLKEFARFVIRTECWSMFEHDGGSIQDLAEKLGLIKPYIVTKDDDIDKEFDDYDVGDTIYKFSEILSKP